MFAASPVPRSNRRGCAFKRCVATIASALSLRDFLFSSRIFSSLDFALSVSYFVLMMSTIAEIARAAGHHFPVPENATPRDVELTYERDYLQHGIVAYKSRLESQEDDLRQ